MNFPSRRTPRVMEFIAINILDDGTDVRTSVVFVVPQEIACYANFVSLVFTRLNTSILQLKKSRQRVNADVVAVDRPLRPGRNLTDYRCRITNSRWVITWIFKYFEVPVMKSSASAIC